MRWTGPSGGTSQTQRVSSGLGRAWMFESACLTANLTRAGCIYVATALCRAKREPRPRLVFLDPDTGVEPDTLKAAHASLQDIEAVWNALEPREILAVYQHAAHKTDWLPQSKKRLGQVCAGADVRFITGSTAKDVAILWAVKV